MAGMQQSKTTADDATIVARASSAPLVMAIVGAAVSIAITWSPEAALALPVASVKAPAATERTPSSVLTAVGVKVAV